MNSSRPPIFNMVRPCALIMTILFAGATTGFAEVFIWSPQCPNPTWFGVCDGEICDVDNNTPLSLNNWGRSGCGSVAFPGVDDDVEINDGSVSLVDTAVGTLSIGIDGVVDQPIGTQFGFTQFNNGGQLLLRDNLNISPTTGDYPDISNSGLIRCIGDVAIGDLTHTGHIDVEQGSFTLTGDLSVNGGTVQVASDTTASFFASTRFTGDFVAEVAGSFQFQDPNTTFPTAMTIQAPGGSFDFRGNGLELKGGLIAIPEPLTLVNKPTSTMRNTEDGGVLLGQFINEGLFIDDSFRNSPAQRSDFENRGEYRIVQGMIDGDLTRNRGLMRKVSPSSVTLNSDLDLPEGELRIEEGTLVVNGGLSALDAATTSISPGASLEVFPSSLSGRLNIDNEGVLSFAPFTTMIGSGGFTLNATGNGASVSFFQVVGVNATTYVENAPSSKWIQLPNTSVRFLTDVFNRGEFIQSGGSMQVGFGTPPSQRFLNTGIYRMEATDSEPELLNIDNAGSLIKSGDLVGRVTWLNNSGLLTVEEGAFEVTREIVGTESGFIDVRPNTTFLLGNTTPNEPGSVRSKGTINGFVAPGGQFLVQAGQPILLDFEKLTLNIGGEGIIWELSGGGVLYAGFATSIENGESGKITIVGSTVGTFPPNAIIRSTFINHGLIVNTGRIAYVTSGIARLENRGEFVLSGEDSVLSVTTTNFGRLICRTTGLTGLSSIQNMGRVLVETGNPSFFGAQLISGQFEVAEGAEVTFVNSHPSDPTLDLEVVGGTLGGGGTINGAIVNDNGVITPGSPIGELTVNGYLGNMPGTTAGFEIELAGPPESGNFDRVTINGEFGIFGGGGLQNWGALRVVISDGFVPQPGMTYEILNVSLSSAEGRFNNVVLVNFPPGLTIEQSSTLTTHSITIVEGDAPGRMGDMNCDRRVDTDDIIGFATALTDSDAYAFEIPICDANRADMNQDGSLNGADIPLFMQLLLE